MVRALQLQELARAPARRCRPTGRRCCRARARTPAPSTSATASPRSSRSNRTTTRRSSSRIRARRPASAASSATSSRWARGRSRCSNSLRFGALDAPGTRRLLEGVVAGIAGYGNSIGIPTVGGEIVVRAVATPATRSSTCSASASRKASDIIKGVASGVGNPVYYVGAKTGRDGIHGATMASAEFDEKSAEKRPAVQVGDPFMEKLLLEACLEVMQTDALVGIQDMGAAGLTCSTTEMGSRGGAGIEIDVVARAAARDRHDAVRDHALRVAGAHAARRQARPRSGGRARSSTSGICTRRASAR